MLRYREDLGLLPPVRDAIRWSGALAKPPGGPAAPRGPAAARGPAHRQFSEEDLAAVAAALELEQRYDITPAALSFGLRVLTEPGVRAAVIDLARRLRRIPPTPGRALDFEKERALRLLRPQPPQPPQPPRGSRD